MRGIMAMRVGAGALGLLGAVAWYGGGTHLDVILAIAGAAVLALLVWEGVSRLRHGNEAAEFAASHGWEHVQRTAAYSTRFSGTPFDATGSSVRQEDVLRGVYGGIRCATFTHVVERQHDGERSAAQVYQVTLAELPVLLPRLDIVPENLAHTVAQALGGVDVEVESHEFNRRWRVVTRDPRYGHDVIDPRMIERLLQPDAQGRSIRISGGAVLTWTAGREGVDTLAKRLDVVVGVARRIPAHVVRRFSEGGGSLVDDAPLAGPAWATTPGVLNSRRYTGIGADADGDGVEDWRQPGERLGSDDETR
ncbi:hypothetical protein [Demequina subtropica]|uniref:hypothetical protein n=1 Tax=Demequina subtropica TaxID=1638989 RepID=UPI000781DB04|nr:hypothetical protein [Demequina subtropica]